MNTTRHIPNSFWIFFLMSLPLATVRAQDARVPSNPVEIRVDLDQDKAPMEPVWAWLGYDEPNYTYLPNGAKLLSEFADLSPVPVYVRAHNLLTTGDGTPALKWGSTNAYTEDDNGNPVYDWTIMDRIMDTYVDRGMRPLVEIGFMPKALSSNPEPYQHVWAPDKPYQEVYTGWTYPPTDYDKFAELVYQWVRHSVDRYGREEVETWLWELWNEPNIPYWSGTLEEYLKLYDYSMDAVLRALPTATVGGPHTTGPAVEGAADYLRAFLDHTIGGTNFKTGKTGSPLHFIAFHAKGFPRVVDGHVRMNLGRQLRDINAGFDIVASYPELKDLPVIIGESDPEGCAACSEADNPHNAYRNGTMYAVYTAAAFSRKYALADRYGTNFEGAVTWAFEFENEPWFAGFRALSTNGIDKPVLNVFRMFGMMAGNRVTVTGGTDYELMQVVEESVRGDLPDVNALATKSEHQAAVLVWNYHDDHLPAPPAAVSVSVDGLPVGRVHLEHFRIDSEHSNAYEVWKSMGSPQSPTREQYDELDSLDDLELLETPKWVSTERDGSLKLDFVLPRQGVSLLKISW